MQLRTSSSQFQPRRRRRHRGPTAGPAYRINAGDEIEVMVWGDERLQRTVRVLPDGTFAFPLVGQIVATNQLPPIWSGSSPLRFGRSIAAWSRR